ncbi:hypothetical protein DSCA_33360 [Desulfosarcina alkanivorans]|uniref:GAF domain-containing protein n=1 Tax=Desulfosarcina alkanivorans TaxID=571177 RepID=A0A5K7YJM2_9BACT|nr:hypothetical protein DSCA_33360 [Desulfosarcina alkanivorans]
MLATQCRNARADAAVVVRPGQKNRLEILAAYPGPVASKPALDWVARAHEPFHRVMADGKSVLVPEMPAPGGSTEPLGTVLGVPIRNEATVRAVALFLLRASTTHEGSAPLTLLETTPLLLEHYELRLAFDHGQAAMKRLGQVLDVLTVVNRSHRFLSAAMALCNEMATRLDCSRVSLGFLNGRCVKVQAMSHTDTVNREMKRVQAIEAAMEECLDQDVEVIYPASDTAAVVCRATAGLAGEHGPAGVLSLPIREDGGAAAVMTLERTPERPFDRPEEIEAVRLICDLCAPRLLDLRQNDRWFGARVASWARQPMESLIGHEHTWIKVAAILFFFLMVFLATTRGDYRLDAAFVLEARNQQAVVAPFDAFTKSVLVAPGDRVEAGQTILGTLETTELRLKRAALKAEQLGYRKQMTASMRDRKTADAQIAGAQSDKLAAEIRLVDSKIEQATLVAPITGRIISEDLKQQIGAPVETGEILFEIARIDALRATLFVPETSVAGVTAGQAGELASEGHPGQRIRFVIEQVNPIAEIVDHQNVFRVHARIVNHLEWMRPGMKGRARISAGQRSRLWIVSHRVVDWLRMALWI